MNEPGNLRAMRWFSPVWAACALACSCDADQFVADGGSDATVDVSSVPDAGGPGDSAVVEAASDACSFISSGGGCVEPDGCDSGLNLLPTACCITDAGSTCTGITGCINGAALGCVSTPNCADLLDGGHCCFSGSVSIGQCPLVIENGNTACSLLACTLSEPTVCKVDAECGTGKTCQRATFALNGDYFIGLCE
jgi:hypothetical protein